MSKFNNIEDFFKDSFDDFEQSPSGDLWGKIDEKISGNDVQQVYKTAFDNFASSPSANVWDNIYRRLILIRFFRFQPNTFNVYYSAAGIILATLIFVGLFNSSPSKTNKSNINSSIGKNEKSKDLAVVEDPRKGESDRNSSKKDGNSEKDVVKSLNDPSKNKNQSRPAKNVVPVNTAPTLQQEINRRLQENQKAKQKNTSYFRNSVIQTDDTQLAYSITNEQKKSEKTSDVSLMLLSSKKFGGLNLNLTDWKPDSIVFNAQGNPIILQLTRFSLSAYCSGAQNQPLFIPSNSEHQTYSNYVDSLTSPDYSVSYGLDFAYTYKNFIFQTGLSMQTFTEGFKNRQTQLDIVQKPYTNYFDRLVSSWDTVWFLNLDSLLQGDSVWVPVPVETTYTVRDSNILYTNDTLKQYLYKKEQNKYRYFEIPLMVGYQVKDNRFTYSLKAGIITGILQAVKGYNVSSDNKFTSLDLANNPFGKYHFSAILSLGVSYNFNGHWSVFGEPYIRRSINSVFEKNYLLAKKFSSGGLKVGINYIF